MSPPSHLPAILLFVIALALAIGAVYLMARRTVGGESAPTQPVEPPALSCFVKGIIRSMRETPDDWGLVNNQCWHYAPDHRSLRRDCELDYARGYGIKSYWWVRDQSVTEAESCAIEAQGIAFLIAHRQAKDERLRAVARAPFEALGCPSDSSPHLG